MEQGSGVPHPAVNLGDHEVCPQGFYAAATRWDQLESSRSAVAAVL